MKTSPRRALIVIDVQNEYVTGNLLIEHPPVNESLHNIGLAIDAARASGIPVIVLSGMSQRNEEKLKRAGASAFLEKGPLLENPKPLLEAIKKILLQTPPWLSIDDNPSPMTAKDTGE